MQDKNPFGPAHEHTSLFWKIKEYFVEEFGGKRAGTERLLYLVYKYPEIIMRARDLDRDGLISQIHMMNNRHDLTDRQRDELIELIQQH